MSYVTLLAGRIENWRLGASGDNLRSSPYFRMQADSPTFNRLSAAMYDVFFSKLTNMGRLVPDNHRTLADVFKEKIYGTDKYLVSAEIIAYLKWLIYVAAFKDRGNVAHELFNIKEFAYLNKPSSARWRSFFCAELLEWYIEFPSFKKRKNRSRGVPIQEAVEVDCAFKDVDGFNDPWEHLNRAAPPAAAAAAAANSAAGGGGGLA